jgi:hypothetical protein
VAHAKALFQVSQRTDTRRWEVRCRFCPWKSDADRRIRARDLGHDHYNASHNGPYPRGEN